MPTLADKITPAARRRLAKTLNTHLCELGKKYHDGIPVSAICDMVSAAGLDAEELHGIYCGRDGRANANLGHNLYLQLTWHKMEVSGRYEIVAYVS